MAIRFAGKSYEQIAFERIQPAEVDAIERVTGFTFPKIRRMAEMCVCEHGQKEHAHTDDEGVQTDDTSCTTCDCEAHEPDVPTRINTAIMWVTIKRADPTVTFRAVSEQAMIDFADEDDPQDSPSESPDPTDPPPAEG